MVAQVNQDSLALSAIEPLVFSLAFVFLASLLEQFVEKEDGLPARMVRVGWDICAFSFGVAPAVFSIGTVAEHYGLSGIYSRITSCFIVSLFAIILILFLRRDHRYTGIKGICSVGLAGGASAFPMIFYMHAFALNFFALIRGLI